jgi:endonuclease YncB( thermonuclease family)
VLKGRSLLPPLIALALFAITVPAHWADSRSLVASVQCVSDGDTIIAMTADGTKLRVRLLGIDAPEIPPATNPASPTERKPETTSIIRSAGKPYALTPTARTSTTVSSP